MNKHNTIHRPRILFVANVTKEHVLKFHIPTIRKLVSEGWIVDVASGGQIETLALFLTFYGCALNHCDT